MTYINIHTLGCMVDRLHYMAVGLTEAGVEEIIKNSASQNGYIFKRVSSVFFEYVLSKNVGGNTKEVYVRIDENIVEGRLAGYSVRFTNLSSLKIDWLYIDKSKKKKEEISQTVYDYIRELDP